MTEIKTAGIAGAGVIGAGWAARFLAQGINVVVYDPVPEAEQPLEAKIETAWPSIRQLYGAKSRCRGELRFTTKLEQMVCAADWIQEAAPEREDLKIALFRQMDALSSADVVMASSSSGFLPSRLQSGCAHPERVLIGHPFNPVYLLPLVEIVPGDQTSTETMDRATRFYESIHMKVLRLKKEIDGYICDRLQEALWREALHIMNKDIVTPEEIDDSIVYSAGLRWAFMGPFLTYHLAGGEGGMRHFLAQFDPALDLPWTDLPFPKWSKQLEDRIVNGCEQSYGDTTVSEWETKRNAVLVDLIKVLEKHHIGVGGAAQQDVPRSPKQVTTDPLKVDTNRR